MKLTLGLGAAVLWTALAVQAQATTNVALGSDGASFVSASSFIDYSHYGLTLINGGQTTAQNNLLTAAPTAWLSDADTRYLFSDFDTVSAVTIELGSQQSLSSLGATWFGAGYFDRAPTSFSVAISTNGTVFTPVGSVLTSLPSGGGADLISFSTPVDAKFIRYTFGGLGGGPDDGIGIAELFASSVPEPATWAMMLVGLGGLGAAMRSRRRLESIAAAQASAPGPNR